MKKKAFFIILFAGAVEVYSQDYSTVNALIFEKKQYHEASRLLDLIAVSNPEKDSLYFYRGIILYLKDKKYDEASANFEKCISLNPKNSTYYTWNAKVLGQIAKSRNIFGQLDLAGKVKYHLEKAIELDNKNFEARFMLVTFHMVAPGILGGNQEEAKKIANDYEKTDMEKYSILSGLIMLNQKKIDEFLEIFCKTDPPNDKEVLGFYRDTFLFTSYDRIVELMRTNPLGETELEKVKKWSLRVCEVFPQSPYGLWGYGRYLTEKKQYDDAIIKFRQAIMLDSKYSPAYYRLGIAYQLKGERDNAIAAFEKFLSFESANKQHSKDAYKRIKKMKESDK